MEACFLMDQKMLIIYDMASFFFKGSVLAGLALWFAQVVYQTMLVLKIWASHTSPLPKVVTQKGPA